MIKKIPGTDGAYGCDTEGNVYSFYLRGSHERKLIDTPQNCVLIKVQVINIYWLELLWMDILKIAWFIGWWPLHG